MKLRLLDLFSGIGGFSLGLERSGNFETVAFCEIEPYPRAVLKKHWPNVKVYEDVKELSRERLEADGLGVDAICGGFPCQDISTAGRGAGLAGERSGLWFDFHRLIKEIKPQVAIIENVSALRSRGLDQVLRSLAEIGYDAEWHCIPASAVGAPHRRDRIWIVAYTMRQRTQIQVEREQPAKQMLGGDGEKGRTLSNAGSWATKPRVGGVAYGLPGRVDRVNRCGNAVVPQIPEMIGKAIA
jgi:DNA (cytosine-5)-methyltransferase 1